jgi:hypothetical protein
MLWSSPLPPPLSSVSWTGDTQGDWERDTAFWRERGVACGRGAKSYDGDKALSSINYSILSGEKCPSSVAVTSPSCTCSTTGSCPSSLGGAPGNQCKINHKNHYVCFWISKNKSWTIFSIWKLYVYRSKLELISLLVWPTYGFAN